MSQPFLMNARISKRSHQACENCRRKKTRCPGERPACSTCTRLQQTCQYNRTYDALERSHGSDRVLEDRLLQLEEKMELMLEGPISNRQVHTPKSHSRRIHSRENTLESSDRQEIPIMPTRPSGEMSMQSTSTRPFTMPPKEIITEGIALYFQYCHKQPLWLFHPEDLAVPAKCRSEVVFGILSLSLRYSNNPFLEGRTDQMCRQYAEAARSYAMFRIAQGTVNLSTLQSFCLIALAEYIANDTHLARLHIGLATDLAKCAGIDIELHEGEVIPELEERRRVFWSIHLLNQQYAPHNMHINMLQDIHNPKYMAANTDSPREMGAKPPQVPQENGAFTSRGGIWIYMVQLSSLWSEVQHYVSHCASGDTTPPWSVDSGYCIIGAHLMDIETNFPTTHRYDSARFQEQSPEELNSDRGYWSAWLYLQFTYHAVHSVLNHPFLYSWRPQQSAQLAVPNTFWKTSSELALIHTTWTVRLVDMIIEKGYQLSDHFLGHAVAIAATIHIYYCRAADPAVRESSQRKLETCTRFLSELAPRWPRIQAIHQKIQTLIRSAFAVSPHTTSDDHQPRRTLSIDTALMWDILCHKSPKTQFDSPGESLFDASFLRPLGKQRRGQMTVETEVFHHFATAVDTSDGGQAMPPCSSTLHGRADDENLEDEPWSRHNSDPFENNPEQVPLREPFAWSGSGFLGDASFMDIMHDPFFQFQDRENPYTGVWEIGNL